MKTRLIAIGSARQGPEAALFRHYAERLVPPLELVEIVIRKKLVGEALIAAEAAEIESKLARSQGKGRIVIALDEKGHDISSRDFAKRLEAIAATGIGHVDFVIGGADGLADSLRRRADLVLAFGRMTWPHLLVRALLAEQLYRTQTIRAGHPYHRD